MYKVGSMWSKHANNQQVFFARSPNRYCHVFPAWECMLCLLHQRQLQRLWKAFRDDECVCDSVCVCVCVWRFRWISSVRSLVWSPFYTSFLYTPSSLISVKTLSTKVCDVSPSSCPSFGSPFRDQLKITKFCRSARSIGTDILSRTHINLDMLIWFSESCLSGWFSEVSLIRDNQGMETVWLSKGLIIKEWKAWLSLIIKLSTTSLPTFPILTTIHRTKQLTE